MTISYNFYSLINAFIPLFIISFFLLDSMFNVNIKGLVLIIGLCINIIVTIIIGNSLNIPTNDNNNLVSYIGGDLDKNKNILLNKLGYDI